MSAAPSVADLRRVTTTTITTAGAFLGMSKSAAYRAADAGDLPTIQVSGHRRVPTPLLLGLVGLPYEVGALPTTTGPHITQEVTS
ncbi:MerR family transcriptional regulator [Georgenia satyanarayanai]|uniref:DNA-binding protein n=1 Tax=Georgenia satyanarayanai TaxID=860221 RepID=UPI00186B0C2A|nr:DNA-binding protein [Georgenia satyanarayanai]